MPIGITIPEYLQTLDGGGVAVKRHSEHRNRALDSDFRRHPEAAADAEQARAREASAAGHRPRRVDYDAELRMHNEVLRRAYGIRAHDHVLDIGCGTGQTTRDAARLAAPGCAVGVDISAPAIERARKVTEAAGFHNVAFEHADAESHDFPSGRFDVAISRFGTMFFADPVAAFSNIGRALRPGGRLVMMVWRDHDRNEWSVSIERALTGSTDVPVASQGAPDPFSLADSTATARILETAGFVEAVFTDVHESVYYGPDLDAAIEWVCGFLSVNDTLQRLDSGSKERALEGLRQALAAHGSEEGVWFDSRAWIVAARRR